MNTSLFITQDVSENCTWFLEAGLSHLSTTHLSKTIFANHEQSLQFGKGTTLDRPQ